MMIELEVRSQIKSWYLANAPRAALAEIAEAREYAERSSVSRIRALKRWDDCGRRIEHLLRPLVAATESGTQPIKLASEDEFADDEGGPADER